MKFFAAIATIVAITSAAAIPAELEERQTALCSSGTALCCQLDVLGVVDATCTSRTYPALPCPPPFQPRTNLWSHGLADPMGA